MRRESSNECLIIGFKTKHKLSMIFDKFYENTYSKEVTEVLISLINDEAYFKSVLNNRFLSIRYAVQHQ